MKPIGWVLAGAACAIPFVAAVAIVPRAMQEREVARQQAEKDAERDRRDAEWSRRGADGRRLARMDHRDDRFAAGLASTRLNTQCDAALAIGRTKRTEFAATLHTMLRESTNDRLTVCLSHALIDLGETDEPLRIFEAWAEDGDHDRLRSAIAVFGAIGPSAADVALPHAAAELKHPHADARLNAANTLSKLGPKARPLLEQAVRDQDAIVRTIAQDALDRLDGPS
jgi:hypothetical protein